MTTHPLRPIRPLIAPRASVPALTLVHSAPTPFEQPTLDLDFLRPRAPLTLVTPAPSHRRATEAFGGERTSTDDNLFSHRATGTDELPPAAIWSRTFAQALAEVMYGKRPPRQVERWVTPKFGAYLKSSLFQRDVALMQGSQPARRTDRVRVARIRVDEPADGVAHVAAVIETRQRSRALAYRLEGWDGRWICTNANLL